MAKTITLKYAARCADCGAALEAGTQARWYGHGRVYGLTCHTRETSSRKPKVTTYRTSGGTFTRCNCEDYPCCGH